jgi:hypothetical protein
MSDSCDGPEVLVFPAGTEIVYLVFDYVEMHGDEWQIWVGNDVTLYDATHSYTGSGTECIPLTYVGGAIPAGSYTTNMYSSGILPIHSLLWHVRPGGPGEITNLHSALSQLARISIV